jgi:hypothetical protein
MAQARMYTLADQLADELLASKNPFYIQKWAINSRGVPTDEEVVVIAFRAKKARSERIQETVTKSVPVATLTAGTPCPFCRGTGKA